MVWNSRQLCVRIALRTAWLRYTDDAIKDHWKAAVAANHWGNQHIDADVKNGVVTLKGDVDRASQRAAMEKTASSLPGVQQVVNELEVKGAKRHAPATQD
jgi:osmotically-inducible protein OsmY